MAAGQNADRAPQFIILGVQKCGTTALYDYLCQHSLVRRAAQKETHFFDWRFEQARRSRPTSTQEQLLARWEEKDCTGDPVSSLSKPTFGSEDHAGRVYPLLFPLDEMLANPLLISGEATPSYLLMGRVVARRLKKYCPNTRFIIATRDPVKRALSQYNMTRDPVGTPAQLQRRGFAELGGKSYSDVVEEELENLTNAGISVDTTNDEFQAYLDARVPWKSSAGEYHGGHSWLLRGLYALQTRIFLEFFSPEAFCIVRMEDLAKQPNEVMAKIHKHIGIAVESLPEHELVPKNARTYERTIDETTERLEAKMREFFEPFNQQWADLCQEHGW